MLKVIVRRVLISLPLLFVVSILTFILQTFVPGDPARTLLGANATEAQYQALRVALHLNDPLWLQYSDYISEVFKGDLGRSIFTGDAVATTLSQRLPVSLSLMFGATLIAGLVGVLLGVFSATGGRIWRQVVDVLSLFGMSLPTFWVALLLAAVFAVALRLLPATGYVSITASPSLWLMSLILPVVALSLHGVALVSKVVRDGVKTAMRMDYIRTLRACGTPPRVLVWKHALRNTAPQLVTTLSLIFIASLSGAVMVETVFVLPGLGSAAVSATNQHDIPVIQGIALAFTVVVIIVNLIVDVAYGLLNPKVRTA